MHHRCTANYCEVPGGDVAMFAGMTCVRGLRPMGMVIDSSRVDACYQIGWQVLRHLVMPLFRQEMSLAPVQCRDKEQEAAWPAVRAAGGVGRVASCTSCTTGDAARSLSFGTKHLYATRKAMAMERGALLKGPSLRQRQEVGLTSKSSAGALRCVVPKTKVSFTSTPLSQSHSGHMN